MRKYLFGLAAICGTACGVSEDISPNNAHEGWYFGAGVSYQHTTLKIKQSDYFGQANATKFPGYDKHEVASHNPGYVGGTILGGYGVLISGCCYVGAELILDMSDDQKRSFETRDSRFPAGRVVTKVNTKVVGFVPTVAVRVGWLASAIDTMFYAKVGGAYFQTKSDAVVETTNANGAKKSFEPTKLEKKSFVPVIGIGIERGLLDHWNIRIEGDWRFSSNKEGDGVTKVPGGWQKFKAQSDGYVIRFVVTRVF